MIRTIGIGFLALLLGTAQVAPAHACACCAEPGTRIFGRTALDNFTRNEVASLRFARRAHLFTTAAGWDDIAGIDNPAASEIYNIKVDRARQQWRLTINDGDGHKGTLSFRLPDKLEFSSIDPSPRPGRSPNLNKEWRFRAPVSGTGMFADGLAENAEAELVFLGRGNVCASADQFRYWTLDVRGPTAKFRFFGALKRP